MRSIRLTGFADHDPTPSHPKGLGGTFEHGARPSGGRTDRWGLLLSLPDMFHVCVWGLSEIKADFNTNWLNARHPLRTNTTASRQAAPVANNIAHLGSGPIFPMKRPHRRVCESLPVAQRKKAI